MAKTRKESFFWTSYSDLMTSMFFVMLVLFVLTISMLHYKMVKTAKERDATAAQLEKIQRLEKSIEKIDPDYFQYNEEFKRHTLKNVSVSFRGRSSNINDIEKEDLIRLRNAGRAIVDFMRDAQRSIPDAEYMLIVEGQASRDNYPLNDELSYSRALSLVNYWRSEGIVFDSMPCELIVSGSGYKSRFREQPDIVGNFANQRFVIHIIPKPDNFTK